MFDRRRPAKCVTAAKVIVNSRVGEFTGFALLPPLVAALEDSAPNVCVRMTYSTHRESLEDLASGRVHFALSFSDEGATVSSGIESLDCLADGYMVATRQKHSRIRKQLSLRQYLAERHVVVTPWHTEGSVVDAVLQKLGLERDVAVQLPSLLAAPFVVAATDHLITLPRRAALRLADAVRLSIYPVPFDVPGYRMKVLFHRQHSATDAMRWMREQMLRALGATDNAVAER